jgi:hypothetical protein
VWELKTPGGEKRHIAVGVLKSNDRAADIRMLLDWLAGSFGLQ